MRGLNGKRVVITGGASGIGEATTERFVAEGARVVVFDRDLPGGEKLRNRLPGLAGFIPCDVSDLDRIPAAFAEAVAIMGGVDVLINNAGISIRHGSCLDITADEWNRVIGINLTGAFFVAQAAAKLMVAQGSGVIVNMASTNGIMGFRYYTDYNATKAGIIELTKSMAVELAPKIRVLAVAPGYVMTPMQRAEYTDEMFEELNQKIPLKRHALPEEVASMFAYLASDEAAYLTGHAYIIDGGEVAGGLCSR
jgi:meso-butanediol dehydrogenase/(S,S)-butanediol dehydrogenase/diacetyl reductase